jgi:hypothetical protein
MTVPLHIAQGLSSSTWSRNLSSAWSGLQVHLTVEHLWVLQFAVARRGQQPCSLHKLENALRAEWNGQIQIQRLIRSTRWWCQTVIAARGSHTHYWASHYSLLSSELVSEKKISFRLNVQFKGVTSLHPCVALSVIDQFLPVMMNLLFYYSCVILIILGPAEIICWNLV